MLRILIAAALASFAIVSTSAPAAESGLRLEVSADFSWGVTSTLIDGKTKSMLIDCQPRVPQAMKLADQIAAAGRQLNVIVITHPDHDHFNGVAVLHEQFPMAGIYMTEAAHPPKEDTTPRSLPVPQVLPATLSWVDGEAVQVIKNLQGDLKRSSNSVIWVPSLEAMIASDSVFEGIHPWLSDSNEQTLAKRIQSLNLIASLHPSNRRAGSQGNQSSLNFPAVCYRKERS